MTSAVPNIPFGQYARSSSDIKSATPDIIIEDPSEIPIELIQQLVFEDIGSQELLLLARHDNLSGQNVAYRTISNLQDVAIKYGPETLLYASESFKDYFKNFGILLESVVPEILEDGQVINAAPNMYVNQSDGSVTIEFKDFRAGYEVELEIVESSNVFDDTIY